MTRSRSIRRLLPAAILAATLLPCGCDAAPVKTDATDSRGVVMAQVRKGIKVVYLVRDDQWVKGVGSGLAFVRRLIQTYDTVGIARGDWQISVVVFGDAGYWLVNDAAYNAYKKVDTGNPNKAIVQELRSLGVSVELCGQTMADKGWTMTDPLPEATVVVGAYARAIDLQLRGYAYIRF